MSDGALAPYMAAHAAVGAAEKAETVAKAVYHAARVASQDARLARRAAYVAYWAAKGEGS